MCVLVKTSFGGHLFLFPSRTAVREGLLLQQCNFITTGGEIKRFCCLSWETIFLFKVIQLRSSCPIWSFRAKERFDIWAYQCWFFFRNSIEEMEIYRKQLLAFQFQDIFFLTAVFSVLKVSFSNCTHTILNIFFHMFQSLNNWSHQISWHVKL